MISATPPVPPPTRVESRPAEPAPVTSRSAPMTIEALPCPAPWDRMAAYERDLYDIEARPVRQWLRRMARWLGLRR